MAAPVSPKRTHISGELMGREYPKKAWTAYAITAAPQHTSSGFSAARRNALTVMLPMNVRNAPSPVTPEHMRSCKYSLCALSRFLPPKNSLDSSP